ncbi:MAG: glycosyltransferase family 4 protein [Gammaproteobacteria bacterium]
MHVAYVDPRPVPGLRAEAMQLLQTVDGLAQAGAQVTLIAPLPRDGTTVEDILGRPLHANVTWLSLFDPRKRWWFPLNTSLPFFRRAVGLLRNLRPDAAMVRHLGVADHILSALPDTRLFFELHEVFADSFQADHPAADARAQRKLERLSAREARVYGRASGLITLTDELAAQVNARYPTGTPCHTISNAVDNVLADLHRRPLDTSTDRTRQILYLGGLHPWKGVELAVEMMQWVEGAHLNVVGGGGGENRTEALQADIDRLGIADRVTLHGPVMPPAERFRIIADNDICVLPLMPNTVGTSPLKLFEYLTMGKPTVCTDLPSLRQLVSDGEHIVLAPPGDARAFARAVTHILNTPASARELGEQGQRLAREHGWDRRGERLLTAFAAVPARS